MGPLEINVFKILLFGVVAIFVIGAAQYLAKNQTQKRKAIYHYRKKRYLMSKPEHDAFHILQNAIGDLYYIFPQIHLSEFLGANIKGRGGMYARRHINQKSVDFLLTTKSGIEPVLAIELDDNTHYRKDRAERDREVERILKEAEFPLLRIKSKDLQLDTLKELVLDSLS